MDNMTIAAFGAATTGGSPAGTEAATGGFADLLAAFLPEGTSTGDLADATAAAITEVPESAELVADIPSTSLFELLAAAATMTSPTLTGERVEADADELALDSGEAEPAAEEAVAVPAEVDVSAEAPVEVLDAADDEAAGPTISPPADEVASVTGEDAPLPQPVSPEAAAPVAGGEPDAEPADDAETPAPTPTRVEGAPDQQVRDGARNARFGARDTGPTDAGRSPVTTAVRDVLADAGRGQQPAGNEPTADRPVDARPVVVPSAPAPAAAPAAAAATGTSRLGEILPSMTNMVEKIAELAERPGPPPHRLTIDLDGLDGGRIAITMRGDFVAVDVVGAAPNQALAQWRSELAAALSARGLALDGGGAEDRHGDRPAQDDADRPTPEPAPRGRSRAGRQTSGWRL